MEREGSLVRGEVRAWMREVCLWGTPVPLCVCVWGHVGEGCRWVGVCMHGALAWSGYRVTGARVEVWMGGYLDGCDWVGAMHGWDAIASS